MANVVNLRLIDYADSIIIDALCACVTIKFCVARVFELKMCVFVLFVLQFALDLAGGVLQQVVINNLLSTEYPPQ